MLIREKRVMMNRLIDAMLEIHVPDIKIKIKGNQRRNPSFLSRIFQFFYSVVPVNIFQFGYFKEVFQSWELCECLCVV